MIYPRAHLTGRSPPARQGMNHGVPLGIPCWTESTRPSGHESRCALGYTLLDEILIYNSHTDSLRIISVFFSKDINPPEIGCLRLDADLKRNIRMAVQLYIA